MRGERGKVARLTARLAGIRTVRPDSVTVYDTLIAPPDTVLLGVALSGGSLRVLGATRDSSRYRPNVARYTLGQCDDGITVLPDGVTCDRAVLGHLELYTEAGAYRTDRYGALARIGVGWRPSYRSTWEVRAAVSTDGRLEALIRKGWRLF